MRVFRLMQAATLVAGGHIERDTFGAERAFQYERDPWIGKSIPMEIGSG